MIAYARLYPGRGFSPARAFLYYIQRLITPFWLRRGIARLIAAIVAARHPFPVRADHQKRERLEKAGLVALPDLVTPEWADKVRAYLDGKAIEAKGRTMTLDQVPSDITIADYSLLTVMSCPLIVALVNAPEVLSLAGAYLGCCPTLSSVGLRWSFPSAAEASDVQRFHRDPDDWRFVKLFVYLTDVDENSGPHIYVQGSHRSDLRVRARPYDLSYIERKYGPDSARMMLGQRGTAFMADTMGIHMGKPPIERPRLMLIAQYSLLPVYAFKYRPLAMLPRPAVDPYINRLIVA